MEGVWYMKMLTPFVGDQGMWNPFNDYAEIVHLTAIQK